MPSSLGGWSQHLNVRQIGPLSYSVSPKGPGSGGRGGSLQYFTRDCLDPFPTYKVIYREGNPWILELQFPSPLVEKDFQQQLRRASQSVAPK